MPNKQLYKQSRNTSEFANVAMARTINIRGYWTPARMAAAGYAESNICSRCGVGAIADELHTFWTCTANCNIDSNNVRNTQYLIHTAIATFKEDPALWGRGVAINRMPLVEDEPQRPTSNIQFYGNMIDGDNSSGAYFADGSRRMQIK